ncbi:MAG: hypothetical protein IPL27_26375 [Lewinellaceae bacterium]|nr:hypothetical protein [Lewinellaceae bacterium]
MKTAPNVTGKPGWGIFRWSATATLSPNVSPSGKRPARGACHPGNPTPHTGNMPMKTG